MGLWKYSDQNILKYAQEKFNFNKFKLPLSKENKKLSHVNTRHNPKRSPDRIHYLFSAERKKYLRMEI